MHTCYTVGMKKPKNLSKDSNKLAYEIVRLSTEEEEVTEQSPIKEEPPEEQPKEGRSAISEYLATIGRKGGLKGGKTRAERLTPEQRKEIARKAANSRWSKS